MTPRGLTPPLHSLPPILHTTCQNPILSCSKGSRGLSVLLRESGIFTTTTISPSLSLRQCPSRYAIRAGRNLPDKELRYLRTLKVRAAVYRGFGSELHPKVNPFPSPTGTEQASVCIHRLSVLAQTCVFSKQSLGPFHCGHPELRGQAPSP